MSYLLLTQLIVVQIPVMGLPQAGSICEMQIFLEKVADVISTE